MIAHLDGKVIRKTGNALVVEVYGVGYLVNVTIDTSAKTAVGQTIQLHTAQIFREDSVTLFGFETVEELDIFNLLGSVSGVGPKSASAIISHLGSSGVREAVATANDSLFKSVPGVGPKTAKLIVLTLTGKLVIAGESAITANSDVVAALVNLGYQEKNAKAVVESVSKSEKNLSEADLLKKSLAQLSSARRVAADE